MKTILFSLRYRPKNLRLIAGLKVMHNKEFLYSDAPINIKNYIRNLIKVFGKKIASLCLIIYDKFYDCNYKIQNILYSEGNVSEFMAYPNSLSSYINYIDVKNFDDKTIIDIIFMEIFHKKVIDPFKYLSYLIQNNLFELYDTLYNYIIEVDINDRYKYNFTIDTYAHNIYTLSDLSDSQKLEKIRYNDQVLLRLNNGKLVNMDLIQTHFLKKLDDGDIKFARMICSDVGEFYVYAIFHMVYNYILYDFQRFIQEDSTFIDIREKRINKFLNNIDIIVDDTKKSNNIKTYLSNIVIKI